MLSPWDRCFRNHSTASSFITRIRPESLKAGKPSFFIQPHNVFREQPYSLHICLVPHITRDISALSHREAMQVLQADHARGRKTTIAIRIPMEKGISVIRLSK